MTVVIFEIDNHFPTDRFVDQFNNSDDTVGNLIQCVGCYKGEQNIAFICRKDDYENFVEPMLFTACQESILEVSECNKAYGVLVYLDDDRREFIGSIKSVDRDTALLQDAWTYRPDINQFFIAVKGNPDEVPPAQGWCVEPYVRLSRSEYDELARAAHKLSLVEYALQ